MISIIIPVFNNENTIEKCIDSYLKQSYTDIEIIVIDDGSKRENAKLYDKISDKYEIVQVYHYKNEGVSAARNHGIDIAKGDYIFFADSDDYAEPDMFKEFMDMQRSYDSEMIVAGYYFDITTKFENTKYIKQCVESKILNGKEKINNAMIDLWDASMMYNIWNKLFKTKIIKEHNICFPMKKFFNEDRDFIREYITCIESIHITDKAFYHYVRERAESVTSKYRPDMLEVRKEEINGLTDFFERIGIYNSTTIEYIAREHFDRIVGIVESLFHEKNMSIQEKLQEIERIISDDKTIWCMQKSDPKSRKMKVIHFIYKTRNIYGIYMTMYMIYQIKKNYADLFYKLRQSR